MRLEQSQPHCLGINTGLLPLVTQQVTCQYIQGYRYVLEGKLGVLQPILFKQFRTNECI